MWMTDRMATFIFVFFFFTNYMFYIPYRCLYLISLCILSDPILFGAD